MFLLMDPLLQFFQVFIDAFDEWYRCYEYRFAPMDINLSDLPTSQEREKENSIICIMETAKNDDRLTCRLQK